MATQKEIKSPPISEALIDIKVKLPKSFKIEILRAAPERLTNNYPEIEKQKFFLGIHKISDGKHHAITEEEGLNGFFYKSNDKKDIVQFRRDGFTYNRLHPYTNWDYLIQRAKQTYPIYKEIAKPEAIARLAVRYINHIKIPLPVDDLSEYFSDPPNIPDELPQNVLNFLNRVGLNGFDDNIRANITQILKSETHDIKSQIVMLLDIDVYKTINARIEGDEIWEYFEKFREIKNKIFFKYITEKTVELFE